MGIVPLSRAGFGDRIYYALTAAGIYSMDGLRMRYDSSDLTRIKGIGKASARRIANYFRVTDKMERDGIPE